jgi:uncharacterized protein (DUF58 family)
MQPWQAILLIVVLASLAISSGWRALYMLTYVFLTLFVLSWLWARSSLRQLAFHRAFSGRRIQVGEIFDERLMLDNLSLLPKIWVQIADSSTLPEHRAGYIASIGAHKRAVWHAKTTCRHRGRFQLGPVTASSGDPFGLFCQRAVLSPAQEIVVMPRALHIKNFVLFAGELSGRGRSSYRALQATTNATTIREYTIGDALSRIHWRSSARYNKLMVKEFDLDPAVDVWIFLDLSASVQAGKGEHSTEEYGVTIATTVATYLLRQDLSVGMVVNGERRELLSLDRGERQIERVLELLTVVTAGSGLALQEALALDAFHLGRSTVALIITPSNACDWHDGVYHLQRRGVQVAVVGLDAASFEKKPSAEDMLAVLEDTGIPVMRIKCKEPLAQALEGGANVRFARSRMYSY